LEMNEIQELVNASIEVKTAVVSINKVLSDLGRDFNDIARDLSFMKESIMRTDDDAIPMMYFPRSWGVKIDTIIQRFNGLAEPLNKVTAIQGETINLINKIDIRLENAGLDHERLKGEMSSVSKQSQDTHNAVGQISKEVTIMAPQVKETHRFVLKWKYGIWPAIVAGISALISGAYAIIQIIKGSGVASP